MHKLPRTTAICALTTLLSMAALSSAGPLPPKQQEGATITPNYKEADLSQIIQAVSEVTGKNFIIDPRVNAKVTMLSSTPMSPAAFYEAFLAVLQVMATPRYRPARSSRSCRTPTSGSCRPMTCRTT